MGLKRAVNALELGETDAIPSFEVLEHPGIIQEVSGIDPFQDPLQAYLKALPLLGIDWVVDIPKRAVKFDGPDTTMTVSDGRKVTEWGCSGSSWEDDYGFCERRRRACVPAVGGS